MSPWPKNYREQLSGAACSLCAEGHPEEIGGRIRFFASNWSDGYLHRHGVQRGYVAVIWRGRYVVEPTDLTQEEAIAFWLDVLRVGRVMQAVYSTLKMNYQFLGNRVPHLHCLLAPRFLRDDAAAGDHLPGEGYHDFPEEDVRGEVARLREALRQA